MSPEVVVDATCDCQLCVARTIETYDLPGRCPNCGARFTVRNRKGDRAALSVDCPECEVSVYGWREYSATYASLSAVPGTETKPENEKSASTAVGRDVR